MNFGLRMSQIRWVIGALCVLAVGIYYTIGFFHKQSSQVARHAGTPRRSHRPLAVLGDRAKVSYQTVYTNLHLDVNIVPSTPPAGSNQPDASCIPLPESPRSGVTICPHPVTGDKYISKTLLSNQLWEKDLIHAMEGALKQDPDMMLFDIGCNIGVYTLWAAALDRQVVCVEMVKENAMRVQMALVLSNLSSHVTIVNNALYSDHRELEIKFYRNSNGQSRLNSSKVYTPELWDNSRAGCKVKTICIDDLTPLMSGKPVYIKMDIENTEHFALMCAHRFFKEVDVRIVQMEWVIRVDAESVPILEFMRQHGYASSSNSRTYQPVTLAGYSGDVFFLKKSFFNISD